MGTDTTSTVQRIPTSLIHHVLAAIGAVTVCLLLSPDPVLAQGSDRDDAAAIVRGTASQGRFAEVEYARRVEGAEAGTLFSKGKEAQLVQSPPSPTLGASSPSNVAREPFKDCDVCPEMVVVPGGNFLMGSPETEPGHSADERPRHRVTIGRPFAVGKYEVTIAEWNACVAVAVCAGSRDANSSNNRLPATGMSWDEAQVYVGWLSRRTGKKYRLLSEAEWEYAARAGTTTPYHTGPAISAGQANVADKQTKSAGSNLLTGFGMKVTAKRTVPIGSYPPNGFGLHDVHGNVWEWVEDCVNDGYAGAPTDGNAWTSGKCHRRIIRGGSWIDFPVGVRSAIRSGLGTGARGRTLGLRIARTLD